MSVTVNHTRIDLTGKPYSARTVHDDGRAVVLEPANGGGENLEVLGTDGRPVAGYAVGAWSDYGVENGQDSEPTEGNPADDGTPPRPSGPTVLRIDPGAISFISTIAPPPEPLIQQAIRRMHQASEDVGRAVADMIGANGDRHGVTGVYTLDELARAYERGAFDTSDGLGVDRDA